MQLLSLIKCAARLSSPAKPHSRLRVKSFNDEIHKSFSTLGKSQRTRPGSYRIQSFRFPLALTIERPFSMALTSSSSSSNPFIRPSPPVSPIHARFFINACFNASSLRPVTIDLDELELRTRLLDDVSLHFFQLLFTPELTFLTNAITKRGIDMRIVGLYGGWKGQVWKWYKDARTPTTHLYEVSYRVCKCSELTIRSIWKRKPLKNP